MKAPLYRASPLIGQVINGKTVSHIGGFSPHSKRVDFPDNTALWLTFAEIDRLIAAIPAPDAESQWAQRHEAGCELMGRGTGVPESLCGLADHIEALTGDSPSDALLASLGQVLLQRRADQAELTRLRAIIRESTNG